MRIVAAAILLAFAPAGFARDKSADPSHGVNFYSIEREIALGKQLSTELERQVKLASDPISSEYVNRLLQSLARQSEVPIPVTVRIIESEDLNAFTLPGGHIYINTAMLRLTESEAQLAFVLAHELGHVAARHASREATREQIIQLSSIPLSVLGGWTGLALRQGLAPASKLGLLKGEREFEAEADRLGLETLERAGYDPEASIEVFERIESSQRKTPNRVKRLGNTHPLTASRIARTQKLLEEMDGRREAYVINTSEYEEIRVRFAALDERNADADQTGPTLARPSDPR